MPFNGSGTFSPLTPPYPFVTGTSISAPDVNSVLADMATNGLSNAVTRDGQSPLTAAWAVGGYNITGIGTLGATTLNVSGTATIGTLSVTTVAPTTLTVSGNGTIAGTLGVTGALTGSSTITAATGLTVSAGGATITGNSTITGTLGGLTALTMASGLITASSSGVKFSDNTTQTTAATAYGAAGTVTATTLAASFPIGGGVNLLVKAGRATISGGTATVTFPAAFPTACIGVYMSTTQGGGAPDTVNLTSTPTTSGFSLESSDSGNNQTAMWLAVGY